MTATTEITWTASCIGDSRFAELNGYKVVELSGFGAAGRYIVEPLREDGLPFLAQVPAKGYANTLDEALALTERPCCHGCGKLTDRWHIWPVADGYECKNARR